MQPSTHEEESLFQDGVEALRQGPPAEGGVRPESWSSRFRQSLEIAAGRRKFYLQQPTIFNYPELPHIQFYDPGAFDWVPAIEAATAAIRDELVELLKDGTDDFRAYIQN